MASNVDILEAEAKTWLTTRLRRPAHSEPELNAWWPEIREALDQRALHGEP